MAHVTDTSTFTSNQSKVVEYSAYDNTYHLSSFLFRKNCVPNTFQLVQQIMFSKSAEFVLSFSHLLLLSNRTVSKTAHLSFVMSYIYRKAIVYSQTGFSINYPKILLCHGNLPTVMAAVAKASIGSIHFTWDNIVDIDAARNFDKAILIVYCEALNKSVYIIGETRRKDGEAILEVPQFHGYEVQTWLGFISPDKRNLSDSVYTGAIFVT